VADETRGSDGPPANLDTGSGWGIRAHRDTARHDWDAAPAPLPPPLPALVHAPAPMLESVPPPPPPPLAPHAPPQATAPPGGPTPARRSRNPLLIVGAGVVVVALIAGAGLYLTGSKSPHAASPLSVPIPGTVAVVRGGPAELSLQSLTGGGAQRTVKLPGTPEEILSTPDRSRAFLLDTSHGDVIPVNLVSGKVGSAIPVGKLPVDEEMSSNGATLYVTDNLGGTVIPVNTASGNVAPAQALTQGVDFYVPSPTSAGALVGADTAPGQPGTVYFYNPATGSGAPIGVGTNPVQFAFYSKDGTTVWLTEQGTNSQPGVLYPLDVATHKVGTPIKLGVAPSSYALTPNGLTAVFANETSGTLSIVDLATRSVVATVTLGATPTGVDVDATGTTAWVACALAHTLIPVNLSTHRVGSPVALTNAPGDIALPAASGVAWVLYPSSNGTINFLDGTTGPLARAIRVGNGPDLMIGTGSETSWVANTVTGTVQRIDTSGQTAGKPITVPPDPVDLTLTPDGTSLLVLSYGDGHHSGELTSVSTRTSKVSTPLSVGVAPSNLTVSAAGDLAYIADYQTNAITVVDIVNWKVKGTIALSCGPTDLALTPEGAQLYVACADDSAILAILLPDDTLQAVIPAPGVRSLVMPQEGTNLLIIGDGFLEIVDTTINKITKVAPETGNLVDAVVSSDGATLLAVDNSGAALVMINPTTLATEKSLAVGTRPDQVALSPDGTHAYVLDTSEQRLFVVSVATWKLIATLNVAPNATDVEVPAPVIVPPS
jgi:YVTN family beta-propeller protein